MLCLKRSVAWKRRRGRSKFYTATSDRFSAPATIAWEHIRLGLAQQPGSYRKTNIKSNVPRRLLRTRAILNLAAPRYMMEDRNVAEPAITTSTPLSVERQSLWVCRERVLNWKGGRPPFPVQTHLKIWKEGAFDREHGSEIPRRRYRV